MEEQEGYYFDLHLIDADEDEQFEDDVEQRDAYREHEESGFNPFKD
jgi:hypothetical protein